jgi:hypothetical protein
LEAGCGAADVDMAVRSTIMSYVKRIMVFPPSSLSCWDYAFRIDSADLSMIAGGSPETETKSG